MRVACVIALVLVGCGTPASTPPKSSPTRVKHGGAPASRPAGAATQEIVGQVERIPADPVRRKIVIWGKVQRIITTRHDELPEAKAVSQGGVGDPLTQIRNSTPFDLTIYFAGPCAHHTRLPSGANVTAAFCAGTYNIAAVVDAKDYLPLVRENQEFKGGVGYVLQVVIRQRPR